MYIENSLRIVCTLTKNCCSMYHMTTNKTYQHGPRINEVAGMIITYLFDYGEVRARVIDGNWRPASVVLASQIFPDVAIVTNSKDGAEGYNAYFLTMSALDLLEDAEMIVVSREEAGHRESYRISLAEGI